MGLQYCSAHFMHIFDLVCCCAGLAVRSILQAAKFLYSKESSSRPDEGEKSCENLLPRCLLVARA